MRYSYGVEDCLEYFPVVVDVVFGLRELRKLFYMSFEVGQINFILFCEEVDGVESFSLGLKRVVDFYFAEKERPNDMHFHSFDLLQELAEHGVIRLDPDASGLYNLLN